MKQRTRADRGQHHTGRTGRGTELRPPNRFDRLALEQVDEPLPELAEAPAQPEATQVSRDTTRSIINPVDSPDLGFKWTVNPYRGCEHGCIYCYARPYHELLGFNCGIDFETRIVAKHDAPDLLRRALAEPSWRGEPIVMSGVTDCYQPIESKLQITRRCLEVFVECRQPVRIATKSRLVLRDLDLLQELNRHDAVQIAVSITSLDNRLAAKLEPRAGSPSDRLWMVRRLASAGLPVTVLVAPVIPAITDAQMPAILKAAADAGASGAGWELLRLPHQVKDLFDDWLGRHFPARRQRVLNLLRQAHGGKLYNSTFGHRLTGAGPYADQLRNTFTVFAKRYGLIANGLDTSPPPLNSTAFRHPLGSEQMALFDNSGQT